jgi:hypothetical protein
VGRAASELAEELERGADSPHPMSASVTTDTAVAMIIAWAARNM